jgi:uncharacterized protein YndB with AHSA1/START domain
MPANLYEFRDEWHIPFPIEQVWDLISRPSRYPEWWWKVFLRARLLNDLPEPSVGGRVEFLAKGWLPYKVRYTAETTRLEPPTLMEFKATGDFRTDASRWVLKEENGGTSATLEWNPIVDKAIIKLTSPVAKPLFRSNHSWTMRHGERQLIEYMKIGARG